MRARNFRGVGLLATLACSLLAVRAAQAALVMEYDFRTDQNASFAQSGIPTGATLGGTASVNPVGAGVTATHPAYIVNPKIQSGILDIGDATGRNVLAANFNTVFGTPNNFGNGTIAVVVRPDFTPSASRRYLWGDGSDGNNNHLTLLTDGPLRLSGGRGMENAFNLGTTGTFPWETDTWYLVAASWQQSSGPSTTPASVSGFEGLPDGKLRLYVRELQDGGVLTPDSVATYVADEAVAVWNPRLNARHTGTFRQGNRATFTEGGFGDYALFQYYNTTFTQADFDALFSTLIAPVPEPSSFLLSLGGCVVLVRATRRKRPAC